MFETLLSSGANEAERVLGEAECKEILTRVSDMTDGEGSCSIAVISGWAGETRWARNRSVMAADRRLTSVLIRKRYGVMGISFTVRTNQLDDASLTAAIKWVEKNARLAAHREIDDIQLTPEKFDVVPTVTWSDATYGNTVEARSQLINDVCNRSRESNLMSAGYFESLATSMAQLNKSSDREASTRYNRFTQAQCSITVRDPKGNGSGWAGQTLFDVDGIDEKAIANLAFEKCVQSINPVRIEPGRYTVILEPQAVHNFMSIFISNSVLARTVPEDGHPLLGLEFDRGVGRYWTKLGLKLFDERITVTHDPSDPVLGVVNMEGLAPVTWIKNGVLDTLAYSPQYALKELNDHSAAIFRSSYRMEGGTKSLEEMIAGTDRGLVVTRFSDPVVLNRGSLLSTGVTRDGLWLVERGKITQAIRNMRFTESPMFAFNNVDQIGVPQLVFNPFPGLDNTANLPFMMQNAPMSVIVPPVKVRDFSFTSTVEAI